MERTQKIIRTSIVGIIANVILVLFKIAVGLATHSIAVILDAVNNMSDAMSSLITIIGTKLANRAPDREHPYGYGRIEYLTSMLIAVMVTIAGLTSLRESAVSVLHSQAAEYTTVSLIIIAAGVVAKFLCGTYVKKVGQEIHSGALIASGSDAFFDAVLSAATLGAAFVSMFFQLSLEGILGVVISLLIIKAGIEMLLETLNHIIGVRVDPKLTKEIKKKIAASYDGVHGAYDLTLHNYGPTQLIGSVHIEVDDDMTAREIHHLWRGIVEDMYEEFGVLLTVGVYAANNRPSEFTPMKKEIGAVVKAQEGILSMHGLYVDGERKQVMFDIVVDFKADAEAVRAAIKQELEQRFPAFHINIGVDIDISD